MRSSILKLTYIYTCRSSIFEIKHYSSPLKLLSNSIGLTWFGFFKTKLCPMSHNDLIMDWVSRANSYDFPHVTVWSYGSKIDIKETIVHLIQATSYRIPIQCSERELWIFSHDHLFEMKFGSLKKHYLPQIISLKILRTKLWNFAKMFLRTLASHSKNFSFWTFV